jgi:hypothetical protein
MKVVITNDAGRVLRLFTLDSGEDGDDTAAHAIWYWTNEEWACSDEYSEEVKSEYRKRFESEDYDGFEMARIAQEF